MDEFKQREKSFKELGKLLVQRHGRNAAAQRQTGRPVIDDAALRLGRYLRAARNNANLSPQALADRAGVSLATLLALEQGLIPGREVRLIWLKKLGAALNEDVNNFRLLLGHNLVKTRPQRVLAVGRRFRPVYASTVAAGLCLVLSAVLWLYPLSTSDPSPIAAPTALAPLPPTLIEVRPEARQNMVNAEKQLENQIFLGSEIVETDTSDFPVTDLTDLTFKSHLLGLPTLVDVNAEDRLNMLNAESRFENQVLILRTLININPEERLNMINAEIKL